jgi:hypothetical protein
LSDGFSLLAQNVRQRFPQRLSQSFMIKKIIKGVVHRFGFDIVRYRSHRRPETMKDLTSDPIEDVRTNLLSTGYPEDKVHFVQGKVEETIPAIRPQRLALLRLDTDWYESTKHELEHLFPLLDRRGPLIIDDYGHWQGARRAVDEYIVEHELNLYLHRVDYTCRVAVRTP